MESTKTEENRTEYPRTVKDMDAMGIPEGEAKEGFKIIIMTENFPQIECQTPHNLGISENTKEDKCKTNKQRTIKNIQTKKPCTQAYHFGTTENETKKKFWKKPEGVWETRSLYKKKKELLSTFPQKTCK